MPFYYDVAFLVDNRKSHKELQGHIQFSREPMNALKQQAGSWTMNDEGIEAYEDWSRPHDTCYQCGLRISAVSPVKCQGFSPLI